MTEARFMPTLTPRLLLMLVIVCVIGLLPFDAFAQQSNVWAQGCERWSQDNTLYRLFCSLTSQFGWLPKLLAVFCYIGSAVLVFVGLLQLREYGDDPSQTPLRSVIMKFVLASCLLSLPFAMQIFIGSVTGKKVTQNTNITTKPTLYKGDSLLGHRPP